MKKSKRRLTFATVVAGTALATTLTACHWKGQEPVETVYGPPMDSTYEPAEEEPQDVYGPPIDDNYDEKEEIPEVVYGPPEG